MHCLKWISEPKGTDWMNGRTMLLPFAIRTKYTLHIMLTPLSIDHVVGAFLILQHIGQVVELGFH